MPVGGTDVYGRHGGDGRENPLAVALGRWRMDPKMLPAEKISLVGIEALTPEYDRWAARAALQRARKEGVEVLPWPEVGQPFDFILTASDGRKLRSADLRGKVILIDCWATW